MIRLDSALLDRAFQPASDWMMGRFGRSCLWLASHLIVIGVALDVLDFVLRIVEWGRDGYPARMTIGVSAILVPLWALICWGIYREVAALERRDSSAANPLRLRLMTLRTLFVVFVLFNAALALISSAFPLRMSDMRDLTLFLAFYFASCQRHPPPRMLSVSRFAKGCA